MSPSLPRGSELLGKYFENNRTIGAFQQSIDNERTIAELQAEIDNLRRQLNNNNNNNGGKKRSNRRKHAMRNKRTRRIRKGSRMHKKMH
jgi:hypothetical protein